MSVIIAETILQYTGDYEPQHPRAEKKSAADYRMGNLDSEGGLLRERKAKATRLLCRFAIEPIVGVHDIVVKTTRDTFRACITGWISVYKETYTMWQDGGADTWIVGSMTMDIYRKLPSGKFSSLGWFEQGLPTTNSVLAAAHGRDGFVYIDHVLSLKQEEYSGVGAGLTQLAVERSSQCGLENRVMLDSAWNSAGFYRKLCFTTGDPGKDAAIDRENAKALLEGRKPSNSNHSGEMFLSEDGKRRFQEAINRKSVMAPII